MDGGFGGGGPRPGCAAGTAALEVEAHLLTEQLCLQGGSAMQARCWTTTSCWGCGLTVLHRCAIAHCSAPAALFRLRYTAHALALHETLASPRLSPCCAPQDMHNFMGDMPGPLPPGPPPGPGARPPPRPPPGPPPPGPSGGAGNNFNMRPGALQPCFSDSPGAVSRSGGCQGS